ncbi:pilus assembly PilX family protein [Cellulomonas edaphi]|uniref:Type 4 fimbrial biogenesis protein PilX N-terminal domain-containing protein n=1 Tax=Cellulomonas edaphi TaxID=3053468 RepID=A0ABT7S6H3_9CELL|nr:hypothetical protein [Cellulomons edaphi]MDM7831225.1 hypothetical protein [Cellulomons edaphi]
MMRWVRSRTADGEAGSALVFVVGTMLVLMMLSMSALAYTLSSTKFARYDQDFTGAMAAAQAGIDDYISRMNRDDGYYQSLDCTNKALKTPMTTTNPCSWNSATPVGWLPVDGERTGPRDAYFHYKFDATRAGTEGTITVTSTGRVNGEYRTIEAAVGKGGSTDYVYYTDFESGDPSNKVAYSSTPAAICGGAGYDAAQYWWEGRSAANPQCSEITFVSRDTLRGAVFSNDSVLADGPSFTNGFTSANPDCRNVTSSTSTWNKCLRKATNGTYSTANFNGVQPQYSTALYLDDTSAAFAGYPGCHYYGSTRIQFRADGSMQVWNSKLNNGNKAPLAIAPPAGSAPSCGSVTDLNSPAGASVSVPDNMVIYAAGDVTGLPRSQCDAGQLGGVSGQTLPLGTFTKALVAARPPTSTSTYTYDVSMADSTKYCQEGNLYVEGTLKGRVTLAAEQSVITTGDVVLAGGLNGGDMLGLVATNAVEVFNPRIATVKAATSTRWNTNPESGTTENLSWPKNYADPTGGTAVTGVQIMGSIQTLQHSFYVQQYNQGGCRDTLQVNGSIAQRWRGAVGTGNCSTGYLKSYNYDTRLQYSAPPYFPRWVNAQWSQRYFGEVKTPSAIRG